MSPSPPPSDGDLLLYSTARGFRGRRCLVVGDALLDVFERGRADRLAPDAPAPVVKGIRRESSPGGAANVAANLVSLGAEVSLVCAVGDDLAGAEVLAALDAYGVNTGGALRVPGRATVVKRRIVADGVALARLDSGDTGPLEADFARKVAGRAAALAGGAEVVVVSDYSGGVVGEEVAEALGGHGCVVLDSKEPLRLRWRGLAAATPNHLEAQRALGLPVEADPARIDAGAVGRALKEGIGASLVALTLAEAGVAVVGASGGVARVAGRPVGDAHPNGAGDTFLSAFALALSGGASPVAAARLGVEAATLAVARPGTAPVGLPELLGSLRADGRATLEDDLVRVRRAGGRVVLVWASPDPSRPGHLRALREARLLGDVLVVGLRVEAEGATDLLGELRCVDHVVSSDGARALVGRVAPDVCVVGDGDRGVAEMVEALGGEVVFSATLAEGPGPARVIGAASANGRTGEHEVPGAGL